MLMKICLVEDEQNLATLITRYLEQAGYEVITFHKGQDVLDRLPQLDVKLWILDIMLEDDVNGYEIIKEIRKLDENVPVIFTSARDQDLDKILGLELGSDDYITKPYLPKELVLRVNNIFRRVYDEVKPANVLRYKDYYIDVDKRLVYNVDKEIKLTTLEYDLLLVFIKNISKGFSRDELLNIVWGADYFGSDRAVDNLIRRLRKKMPLLKISTVYGYGYRLNE